MADVKWIKIVTDIFDDEKILLIESMPEADSIIVIWFKLLCLAGKNNNSGVFMLNDKIAYTDEMLSSIFRRPLNTVRLALKTFEKYGMIEIVNNIVTIPNWSKHQTLDSYERKKERDRIYQKERRKKQKLLVEGEKSSDKSSDVSLDSNADVVPLDIDKDIDKDIDIDNISKDILCSTFVQRLIEKWNSINLSTRLTKITQGTNRHKMLKARVKQYGEDEILKAIDEISKSRFLMGKINDFEVTFDWFIKPNNFLKIYEGNYRDKEGESNAGNPREVNESSQTKKPDFSCFE
ncbi:phage replisome organizer N-terminal domain-containing protein [Clostridium baratii]|uniref:phage replisome organizer N-terminal domain-containing protein n=1 Tax=Clostridium baratii TaxID=1561 RepID=UPI0030CC958B